MVRLGREELRRERHPHRRRDGAPVARPAGKARPLPADEKNPFADGANTDDLILWLAHKEAKALIGFDGSLPVAPPPREKN